MISAYCYLLPKLLTTLVGLDIGMKLTLSALLIAPLAFLMGVPFPTGLRAVSLNARGSVEWAWALNAAAGVLGSALAIVVALQSGLTVVLLSAGLIYAVTGLLSISLKSQDVEAAWNVPCVSTTRRQ
jgi:hypothetical protein